MNKFVVVDLETTGNQSKDRIIEIGLVVYVEDQVVDTFQTLLHPGQYIPRFITHLTGITNEMVMDAPTFETIASQLHAYFEDAYFVAHNVPFDLGFLNDAFMRVGLPLLSGPEIDTVEVSRMLLPEAPGFKLSQLSEHLNLAHDDPHRALSDAYVTANLLDHLLGLIKALPQTTLKRLLVLTPGLKSALTGVVEDAIEKKRGQEESSDYHFHHGLAIRAFQDDEIEEGMIEEKYGDWLEHVLTTKSPTFKHYQPRPFQQEMARDIYNAFESKQHLAIEAATGTGKTFAYLLPSAYWAVMKNEQVWISTYVKQLQSQIALEELAKLRQATGLALKVEVLKGKENYIDIKAFGEWLFDTTLDHYDYRLTKAILLVWLTKTQTGDIDEVKLPTNGYLKFKSISARYETKRQDQFSYYQARVEAVKAADIVIVNHALLHQLIKSERFSIQRLIIDEAHHFDEAVEAEEGYVFSDHTFTRLMTDSQRMIKGNTSLETEGRQYLDDAKYEHQLLMDLLYQKVKHQNQSNRYQKSRKQWMIETDDDTLLKAHDLAYRVTLEIKRFIESSERLALNARDQSVLETWRTYLSELKQFFSFELTEQVKWIETEIHGQTRHVYLNVKPKRVDLSIKYRYFDQVDSIVLTSATLTVNHTFDYFFQKLGLKDTPIPTVVFPTHFPIHEQVNLFVPNDFPRIDANKPDPYIEAVAEMVFSLADLTMGRMLVLFNAYDMLNKTYYLLKELFDEDYLLIAQGISSRSHERLKKNFESFEQSILLGTHAFWEGLDLPGDRLTCVVMTRLPFESPDQPMMRAKLNAFEQMNQSGFNQFSLPQAVIRFKQGFGRLIRSETDRGIIVVTDDRIMTKQYGKAFLDSVPRIPVFHRRTSECLELSKQFLENAPKHDQEQEIK